MSLDNFLTGKAILGTLETRRAFFETFKKESPGRLDEDICDKIDYILRFFEKEDFNIRGTPIDALTKVCRELSLIQEASDSFVERVSDLGKEDFPYRNSLILFLVDLVDKSIALVASIWDEQAKKMIAAIEKRQKEKEENFRVEGPKILEHVLEKLEK